MKRALSAVVGIASFLVTEGLIIDANADLISFGFTADVISASDRLSRTFNTSQTLSGSVTYESSTPDLNSLDPNNGRYESAVKALSFTVGQYTGTFSGQDVINVNVGTGVSFFLSSAFSGENVGGARPLQLLLGLFSDKAFSTDALPLVLPSDLHGQAIVQFVDPVVTPPIFQVEGNIMSVTMIPEPSTLLLLATGLVALLFYRKRFVS